MEDYVEKPVNNSMNQAEYYKEIEDSYFSKTYEKELLTVNNAIYTFDRKFTTLDEDKQNNLISDRNYNNITFKMRRKQEELIKRRDEIENIIRR